MRQENGQRLFRRRLTRRIAIEDENDFLGSAPQLEAVFIRQSRAASRERLAHARPCEGDAIEIALTKNGSTGSSNRLECVGVSVQSLALLKDGGLGRIQIFGFLVGLERSTPRIQ